MEDTPQPAPPPPKAKGRKATETQEYAAGPRVVVQYRPREAGHSRF